MLLPRPPSPPLGAAPTRATRFRWLVPLGLGALAPFATATEAPLDFFKTQIEPILAEYCYECHGDGNKKGGVQLDGFENEAQLRDHKLWLRALRNVRSGIMPPADGPTLPPELAEKVSDWIKRGAFGLDPKQPDPGRVTVRRLNRVDYRNTIRELVGIDYDTQIEFPADDTGHGFDNNGDVLTISPMLLEKYLDAAQNIVAAAVPTRSRAVAEVPIEGRAFKTISAPPAVATASNSAPVAPVANTASAAPTLAPGSTGAPAPAFSRPLPKPSGKALDLSYYTPAVVKTTHRVTRAGKYQVVVDLRAVEKYVDDQFDYNRCRLLFRVDGETLLDREFVRQGDVKFKYAYERDWQPGEHQLEIEVIPLGPDKEQKRLLRVRLEGVTVQGPLAPEYWVKPKGYERFFPRDVPADRQARETYAAEILERFAARAFRRPVDAATVQKLVSLATGASSGKDSTFEAGIAQAMVAVLASPRFIFREEEVEPLQPGQVHPLIDEYALASRLSYFFWSSMPDEELFRLAREGQLRANLPAQLKRLLDDKRSAQFVRNFTGQWLQARDISNVQINSLAVFLREHPDPAVDVAQETFRRLNRIPEEKRTPEEAAEFKAARQAFFAVFRAPKPQLTYDLREAMLQETEMSFAYLLKEDRSFLELIESDYAFLNEDLAKHYGIPGVTGAEMRKVMLPPNSPRGGVLTSGTVLTVTSNPTRTSPVKRGVFILNAILGTPAAPPPPNIPALEDVASPEKIKQMTLRETLALHAENAMCRSCHSRMDPLGLALENFNAMGAWRDSDQGRPVAPEGQLITGETFADIRELKHVLATKHRRDYYYCLSEKLLTYALGRGIEYYDTDTLDQLVNQLEAANGRPSALLLGIVQSAPFQQRRAPETLRTADQTSVLTPPPRS